VRALRAPTPGRRGARPAASDRRTGLARRARARTAVAPLLVDRPSLHEATVAQIARGPLKQALVELGWPTEDLATYQDGAALDVRLDPDLQLRGYQADAACAFDAAGAGVIVLPCGSGKTIVGLAAIASQQMETLIVTSNSASLSQWRSELLAKTTLDPESVGEYSGQQKQIRR
jgi:DNA excision repair protein ERCC-3